MCANYETAKQLELNFDAQQATFEYRSEIFPCYDVPILVREDSETMIPLRAIFGMVPGWSDTISYARNTYNCRSETASTKPSFRNAWKRRQFCLVPMQAFYEQKYEGGKRPIRWRIERKDGEAFAAAGIYEYCSLKGDTSGTKVRSCSMLTVNADEHPMMSQFHPPDDEKRSIVLLHRSDFRKWLDCGTDDDARELLYLFDPDEYRTSPAPLPPRTKKAAPETN